MGDITLGGYRDPNLRIWVNPKALDRWSLSVNDLISTVQNEHLEAPAGQVQDGRRQLNVRVMGEAKTVPEFESLTISKRGGETNYLGGVHRPGAGLGQAGGLFQAAHAGSPWRRPCRRKD